jgi:hypothetical protein
LKTIAALLFSCVIFAPVIFSGPSRAADSPALQEHHLRLFHTHTGEHIDIVYRREITIFQRQKRSSILFCVTIVPAT